MISSSEAFEKFSTWKSRRTSLTVTVIERGQPENAFSARICGVDEDDSKIDLVGTAMHSFGMLDVGQAEFSWEPGRMVVSRDDVEWLIFEEPEEE